MFLEEARGVSDPRVFPAQRRHEDDRRPAVTGIVLEHPSGAESRELRHHDVQKDAVTTERLRHAQSLFPIVGDDDIVVEPESPVIMMTVRGSERRAAST